MPVSPTYPLGSLPVRRMGFGAMQLAGRGVFGPPRDRDQAVAVLRRAVEWGVDHIDTSQYYGPDVVNDIIREALHPYPEGLRLVSKVGARRDEQGGWLPAQRPEELREGVEQNLRSLGIEQLAAVNLRLLEPGESSGVALEDQLGELVRLREEGKIAGVGISNADVACVERARALTGLVCVQNSYSLLDRTHEDVLELCLELEIAFMPFFPMGSAFTGGPAKLAADPALAAVAERRGVKPTQVALAWLLQRAGNILLIPGTSSLAHLEENLAAADVELDAEDLRTLEAVQPAPVGPGG